LWYALLINSVVWIGKVHSEQVLLNLKSQLAFSKERCSSFKLHSDDHFDSYDWSNIVLILI